MTLEEYIAGRNAIIEEFGPSALGTQNTAARRLKEYFTQSLEWCRSQRDCDPALLATVLDNYREQNLGAGKRPERMAICEELVRLYRRLYATDPELYGRRHAKELLKLGYYYFHEGYAHIGIAQTENALELFRRLNLHEPKMHNIDMGDALRDLAVMQHAIERDNDALRSLGYAFECYRQASEGRDQDFQLGIILRAIGLVHLTIMQWDLAAESFAKAMQCFDLPKGHPDRDPSVHPYLYRQCDKLRLKAKRHDLVGRMEMNALMDS